MPNTAVIAVSVALFALLVVLLVLRARRKPKDPETPRFEPPRDRVVQPTPAPGAQPAAVPPPADVIGGAAPAIADPAVAQPPTFGPAQPIEPAPTFDAAQPIEPAPFGAAQPIEPAPAFDMETPAFEAEAPPISAAPPPMGEPGPPSSVEVDADELVEATSMRPPGPEASPPAPAPPPVPTRTRFRSYSNITDESVRAESQPAPQGTAAAEAAPPPEPAAEPPPRVEAPSAPVARVSEPKIAPRPARPASEPKLPPRAPSEPRAARAARPTSEPKISPRPSSEPKTAPAVAKRSEPNVAAALPRSEPKLPARFAPPSNPATAELEKNDARHAAARRLARLSVSEIKLYNEQEVKAGREAKDLWKRMQKEITLARQTFEARVDPDVRDRFDYLLDEFVRQLADGDATLLGPDAPALPESSTGAAGAPALDAPAGARPSTPSADAFASEAPTKTVRRTLEPDEPEPPAAPAATATTAPAKAEAKPAAAEPPKPAALRGLPVNPETADLEKNDPRHAAARRLARLSVSEIKLYNEDEVKAGREAKDLWKRLSADIDLARQTIEKRVDKDVRDRFDYLYDEILRQLAEGDVTKLGPEAPTPASAPKLEASAPAPKAPASAPKAPASAPKLGASAPAPKPKAPASAPKLDASAPAPAAASSASRVPAAGASGAARYVPPSNPATAELEKNDPRHAAARRLARLSVSEIKLYHEDEVKAGREAKDLWKRFAADIGLATQNYEKRIDKDVRDRFDYLYDEILRQLAEGDASKLGPGAPTPKPAGE